MVTDRFPLVVEALARLRSRYCIILGLGGAVTWPPAAGAQQAGKLPTIGFPGPKRIRPQTNGSALAQRLREVET
jgi:hypothetical protein